MLSVFGVRTGQEEIDELVPSVRRGWMGLGPKVAEFESAFAARLSLPDLCLVDSGSNALFLAVTLLRLPPGSEVIVPSFTWVACAQAVLLAGHRPVFADVDLSTQNLTPETARRSLTPRTGAIMVVHYAGKPADVSGLAALGLPLIEDAAHAVDSKIGDAFCGSFGDVAIYSFDAVKNLAMPEGGGLTARLPGRVEEARSLRYCGISKSGFESAARHRWWEHRINAVMPKMLPNDVGASIGLAQLRKLDESQAMRKRIWEAYREAFGPLGWLTLPEEAGPLERHSYFTYLVRLERRDELAGYLRENGVYTTLRYEPLHRNPFYGSTDLRLPACETLAEQGLNLPLHPALSDGDVEKVIDLVRRFR